MIDDTLLDAEDRMDKALSVAREDLGSVRTGRAAPSMFNKILVDYYGAPTPVPQMSSITVPEARMAVIKPYDNSQLAAIEKAIRHLEKGRLVIFGAGAGMPYFSTDTVAAQRALEIGCQVLLMAKNGVDGVYDDDPRTNPGAILYEDLDYATVLAKQLKVADATAISLCMDNSMPIFVFNLLRDGNIARAVAGEKIGTLISQPT